MYYSYYLPATTAATTPNRTLRAPGKTDTKKMQIQAETQRKQDVGIALGTGRSTEYV